MKTTLMSLALAFVAMAFSSCSNSGSPTHNMGNPKNQNPMADEKMPNRN